MKAEDKVEPKDLYSIYSEMAEIIGVDNTRKLHNHFGGQQILFPQKIYSKEYVEKYVRDNYDGTNIRELSRKFGYSERTIRSTLKK